MSQRSRTSGHNANRTRSSRGAPYFAPTTDTAGWRRAAPGLEPTPAPVSRAALDSGLARSRPSARRSPRFDIAAKTPAAPPARPIPVARASADTIHRVTANDWNRHGSASLTIDSGPYVAEKANIPASYQWRANPRVSVSDASATASQSNPYNAAGLYTEPHDLGARQAGAGTFRVRPRRGQLNGRSTQGAADIQIYKEGGLLSSDQRILRPRVHFGTVPQLASIGATRYVGQMYVMNPAHFKCVTVAEGGSASETFSHQATISNGYTVSRSTSQQVTLSQSLSSEIGADLKVLSAKIGSSLGTAYTIAQSIGTSASVNFTQATTVSFQHSVRGPGSFAFVPQVKVWETPVTFNIADSSGKHIGRQTIYVRAYRHLDIFSILRANEPCTAIYDSAGNNLL